MAFPFGQTVTVTRQSVNEFGDRTPGASHDVTGCAVWPTTSKETVAGGMDVVVFGMTVLMPPGSDVLSSDYCVVQGVSYIVDDEPTTYQSPLTGTQAGVEVHLKGQTG